MRNFFDIYMNDYIGIHDNTEAPIIYHRWCAVSIIAVLLGRNFVYPCGLGNRMPNQYIQLIGVAAARKSTAIKQAAELLKIYGFNNFAPKSTSYQQYMKDLHNITWKNADDGTGTAPEDECLLVEQTLFGTDDPKKAASSMPNAESLIANDEFNNFIGLGNLAFVSLLGELWDFDGVWDRSFATKDPIYINNPTINILSGNTPTNLFEAFPPGVLDGQGFFSRILLIYGKPTGKKVFPVKAPSDQALALCLKAMQDIQEKCRGVAVITDEAFKLLDAIYRSDYTISDHRFANYMGRRFTNLEKLCLVTAASRYSSVIDAEDVILANTILTIAERGMPSARGEFGRSKNSIVTQKIVDLVCAAKAPMTITDIVHSVFSDLDNIRALHDIINQLVKAKKIQIIDGLICPYYEINIDINKFINTKLLFKEELT